MENRKGQRQYAALRKVKELGSMVRDKPKQKIMRVEQKEITTQKMKSWEATYLPLSSNWTGLRMKREKVFNGISLISRWKLRMTLRSTLKWARRF